MRSGPAGRRTSLRATLWPALVQASAMSAVPIEPNSLPSVPALAVIVSLKSFSASARSLRAATAARWPARSSSARRASKRAMLSRRGQRGLALGQQEIAAVAGLHLHAIADVAEVGDLLQQNDFHGAALSADRCRAAAPGSARA